jgi:flagellar biogenesis protein FliO
MYDTVRWILLGLLFAGLFGLWLWSRRQASRQGPLGGNLGSSFKILQKRWVDQRTGICLVEAEEQTFLLAYTVGGGVSWQALEKSAAGSDKDHTKDSVTTSGRLNVPVVLPETLRSLTRLP